ncbi:MAG TPA: thioredoxin domain-containing protein [Longimicrobium sp.]|nr:thioredoxin domain-containing protein [Longimicrobium sp.]
MPNRLANETSPYLLQHRDNPVDWYPWGPEALERARAEDKPILLSVGYSACHWCHVMEHESFEDAETARLMNDWFVPVKVDREERPDIDSIYMAAVQQMTGHGGWPMTVFLTPDGAPFYGGTYYPPEPRYGMPSFQQVLAGVNDAWVNRRGDVDGSAEALTQAVREGTDLRPPPGVLSPALLDRAFASLAQRFDPNWGGLAGAPKFPQPLTLEFALRTWKRTGDADALRFVEVTLRRMASGGMYDHLGGGFARYSVDAHWLVPHFEKMLYDNALLVQVYLHAWQATGSPEYRAVANDVLRWVINEMTSPEGGFYSALDADSEGEEGRFYLWTPEQLDAVLGPEDGAIVRAWWGVTPGGNFEGRTILHAWRSVESASAEAGVTPERLMAAVTRARPLLYAARAERVWPGLDDKVLTAWNAMMLHAFALAARATGDEMYRQISIRSAEFLLGSLRVDGRLMRTYKEGRAKIPAFLDDHALLADALIALYEATFDARWLREARALADEVLARFWDEDEGLFYDTAADAEALVVRPRDLWDNATPSGTSSAVLMLLRLAELTGEERYRAVADRVLQGMGEVAARAAAGFGNLLSALDFHLATPMEIAIVGTPGEVDTDALLGVAAHAYLPNAVTALRRPEEDGDVEALIPLLRDRTMIGGRATAYVCERMACQMPVHDPAALAEQLGLGGGTSGGGMPGGFSMPADG